MAGLTPEQISELDQTMAGMKEHIIPLVFSFYKGAMDAGFDTTQAFQLARDFMRDSILRRSGE